REVATNAVMASGTGGPASQNTSRRLIPNARSGERGATIRAIFTWRKTELEAATKSHPDGSMNILRRTAPRRATAVSPYCLEELTANRESSGDPERGWQRNCKFGANSERPSGGGSHTSKERNECESCWFFAEWRRSRSGRHRQVRRRSPMCARD